MNNLTRRYQREAWYYLYRGQLDLAAHFIVAAHLIDKQTKKGN